MAPRLLLRTYDDFPGRLGGPLPRSGGGGASSGSPGEGGVLVGVDTASLDPMHSTTMDAHRAAAAYRIAILENLRLDRVAEGADSS